MYYSHCRFSSSILLCASIQASPRISAAPQQAQAQVRYARNRTTVQPSPELFLDCFISARPPAPNASYGHPCSPCFRPGGGLRKLLLNYANLRSLHGLPIPLFCTHCHCPSLTLRHTGTPDPIPATGRDFNEFVSPSHPPISLPSCVGLCF